MKLLWPIPTCLLKDPNKPQTVEVEVPYLHAKDVVCWHPKTIVQTANGTGPVCSVLAGAVLPARGFHLGR